MDLGLSNIVGIERKLQLVREGIVDGWLFNPPDLADCNDPYLNMIQTCEMHMYLLAGKKHPALRKEANLYWDDIADFPGLGFPDGAYPNAQIALK